MKPVMQQIFTKERGDCFAACVASIMEKDLDDVPNFCEGENWDWLKDFCAWLYPLGYTAACVELDFKRRDGRTLVNFLAPEAYYILSGKSPRGDWLHSTVWHGPDMVHDPHPEGGGVQSHVDAVLILPLQRHVPEGMKKCKADATS